jgi:hypothetical protein
MIWPCTVARNETLVVFGSNRDITTPFGQDTGLDVRNAIMWQEDSNNQGSFFYYDCYAGRGHRKMFSNFEIPQNVLQHVWSRCVVRLEKVSVG